MAYFTREQDVPLMSLFNSEDHYEDFGFAVIAECGDYDIYVWETVYIFQGGPHRPRSQWLGDGVADHTLVIVAPRAWRHQGMHNNEYLRFGLNTQAYFKHEDLQIEDVGEAVIWRLGDMEYQCHYTKGAHVVRGSHGPVSYDLTFEQAPGTTTVPIFGEQSEAATLRAAGSYNYSFVNGTMSVGDRTFEIKHGQGLHEHIAFSECPTWDACVITPQRDKKGGGVYGSFRTGDVICQIHSETEDHTTVVVAVDDETHIFKDAAVDLMRTEYWVDPKNGVQVPSRWTLRTQSEAGALEVDVWGYARATWTWELKRGVMLQCVLLNTVVGTFTDRHGKAHPIDGIGCMDYHRMLVCHTETLDGPDLTPSW